jgi:hypothetical protein
MNRFLLTLGVYSLTQCHFVMSQDECATLVPLLNLPSEGTNKPAFVDVSYGDYDYTNSPCQARVVFYKHKSSQQYATPWTDVSLGVLSVFR